MADTTTAKLHSPNALVRSSEQSQQQQYIQVKNHTTGQQEHQIPVSILNDA
jgi:hypothetical protein